MSVLQINKKSILRFGIPLNKKDTFSEELYTGDWVFYNKANKNRQTKVGVGFITGLLNKESIKIIEGIVPGFHPYQNSNMNIIYTINSISRNSHDLIKIDKLTIENKIAKIPIIGSFLIGSTQYIDLYKHWKAYKNVNLKQPK